MSTDIEDVPDLLESEEPEAGPSRALERPKIPLTLLTGYLGAGKSTLLEYVLTADHGYKIAVCMNDFGDTTDIEAKSLTLSDPDSNSQTTALLSLPNGCLCCSFKDMGIAAIEEMVASQKGVDWVMVELTGVADPGWLGESREFKADEAGPIAKSFWANEEMGDLVLDGVVCVVDCRNVMKQLGETKDDSGDVNDCQKQVACADVILLNKTDLVDEKQLHEVEDRIRQINPTLKIHHTVKSRIPLDSLFNIRAFSSDSTGLPLLTRTPETHDHDHPHTKAHYNDITTLHIPLPTLTPSQQEKLESFLQTLLWESRLPEGEAIKGLDILRTKGYFKVEGGGEYVVQGVTDIFEIKEVGAKTGGEEVQGKLVFIGRGVGQELRTAFDAFVAIS